MKPFTLICFIFFSIPFISTAQQIVVEGKQWNMMTLPSFSPDSSSYSIKFEGEVILDSLTYKKVYNSFDPDGIDWNESSNLVREDTVNKQVWTRAGSFGEERLVYDFGLEIGDTLLYDNAEMCPITLLGIDSVMISNGELRKRWKLGSPELPDIPYEFWIEGIGSLDGVLTPLSSTCIHDYPTMLLCHYEDGIDVYIDPVRCFYTTSIKELSLDDHISISPNPARNTLFIEVQKERTRLETVTFYNTLGAMVLNQKLDYNSNEIDLASLPGGAYFLVLQMEDGNAFSTKFIKLND